MLIETMRGPFLRGSHKMIVAEVPQQKGGMTENGGRLGLIFCEDTHCANIVGRLIN